MSAQLYLHPPSCGGSGTVGLEEQLESVMCCVEDGGEGGRGDGRRSVEWCGYIDLDDIDGSVVDIMCRPGKLGIWGESNKMKKRAVRCE